jgi:hypothetical protein
MKAALVGPVVPTMTDPSPETAFATVEGFPRVPSPVITPASQRNAWPEVNSGLL